MPLVFRSAVTALVLLVCITAEFPARAGVAQAGGATQVDIARQLGALRDQDALLAAVALPLLTANAPLCLETMPASGLVLHARNQYPPSVQTFADQLFGFSAPLAVSAVVPGGPADRAGFESNDGIIEGAGIRPQPEDGDGNPDTAVRDGFERALTFVPPADSQRWVIRRGASLHELRLEPLPACRARFEVVPGQAAIARNTGELIQISSRYLETVSREELAVIAAHELAHSVLLHRRRLEAAGVSKGLLAEFGRNGRLNRRVESEADRLSAYLLRNAGFDPESAVRFWTGPVGRAGGGLLRSRTHAAPKARAAMIRAEIAAMPSGPLPLAPPWLEERLTPLR